MTTALSLSVLPVAREPAFFRKRIDQGLDHGPQIHRGSVLLVSRHPRNVSVQMRSNDYLSISANHRIIEAEINYLRQNGHGEAISRVFLHKQEDQHRAFERRIARLLQAEDAVVCMSGYCANIGLLQAIAAPETPIFIDMMAHASLWEGVSS